MNMIKNESKIHNFHMVLTWQMKSNIFNLGKELGLNISDTCLYIIDKALCILEKYHFDIEEKAEISNYQNIFWDKHINIFMDESYYRRIKHLADTMMAFSIAIVIRKLIEFYFDMLELSEFQTERVERIFKRFYLIYVKNYGQTTLFWKKCLVKKQLFGNFQYYLEFNDKFSLTGFNFIKSD